MNVETYKKLGTIRKATRAETDGEGGYFYLPRGSLREGHALTLKDARECLEWAEEDQRKIQAAVALLESRGYKIYEEISRRSFY
jgi:hypothetical protein